MEHANEHNRFLQGLYDKFMHRLDAEKTLPSKPADLQTLVMINILKELEAQNKLLAEQYKVLDKLVSKKIEPVKIEPVVIEPKKSFFERLGLR